jgi:tetratricopeptide (TPR) repeat protein
MSRTIITIAALGAVFGIAGVAAFHSAAITDSQTYRECTEMVRTNPKAALKMASDWSRKENTASARHCHAMALFASKRYKESAEELEKLSILAGETNLSLWANILRQSARAWELMPDEARAITVLTKAIAPAAERGVIDPGAGRIAADLLSARARLYAKGGRDLYAIQDLDHALSLATEHETALLTRAAIFIARKEPDMAREDLKILLAKHPNHPEAITLLNRIEAQ